MGPKMRRFLVVTGIIWAACSTAVVSVAQQSNGLPAAEPANIIRQQQQWFYQQRAYPNKHIPAGARMNALRQFRQMQTATRAAAKKLQQQAGGTTPTAPSTSRTTVAAALSSTSWTLIGPQPTAYSGSSYITSGRVTSLAVDPTNSKVVYLGGAQGGVWKTTDGGTTWAPLTDNQPSLAIGSIAIDPGNTQTIYVGTGEDNFSGDSYSGAGVLKSTDGGATWTQIPGPFVGPFGGGSPYCGGAYIGSIAVDPGNSQVILASAVFDCSIGSGIYRSTDGGGTWTEVLGSAQTPFISSSLVFDPTNGNNVYVSVYYSGSNNGIWKSADAGLTWTIDNGSGTTAFPGSQVARTSLAMAPSSPTTLYAGAADASSGATLGVFKTTDGGATWTQLASAPSYCGGQCWYDNVVAVSPTDPNIVLLGGQAGGTLFLSLDGGANWSDITGDSSGNYIHPDMHAIAFSADGGTMYIGNDGGVWSTSMGSSGVGTWSDLNQQLALTQFYPGMSLNPASSINAFAGSQDNGTQEYSGPLAWNWIGCGDGGFTALDYSTLNTLYARCQLISLVKVTFNPFSEVGALNGIDPSDNTEFIGPLSIDPSNPNTLYFGTYRVYQSNDGAANWTPISGALTQNYPSLITDIAVAPSDPNTVYVATNDAGPWVTTNAHSGAIWSSIANGTPNRYLTAIAVSPANAQTAYAVFSGYSGFSDNLGHVFQTTNGGISWTDISGNLPNVPVNDIVVDPDFANTLYVGTDVGVFETADGGTTWAPLGTGLPVVAIMSLKLQRAARILRAASHGRSAWDIQLPVPVGPGAVLSTPTLDFGAQQLGTTSSAQTVTLANNSTSALAISGIAASTNFAETNDCGAGLAAGASCTISVTFTPVTYGALTGTVTVSDNASGGNSQTVNLNGIGFSGVASLSPPSLTFGNQLVGSTSTAQTVTLTNSGTGPLAITAITPPADFTVSSDCPLSNTGTLGSGLSCSIYISFAPTTKGSLVEQVTVADSAGDSPQSISLTGTGTQTAVTLSSSTLDFGSEPIGTSGIQNVTLTNSGSANLTITAITSSSNQFTESDNCPRSPSTLAPTGSCTLTVTFAPTTWSSGVTGTIQISDDAPGGTQTVDLSGSAYSGVVSLNPASVSFGSVDVGQTSTQTVTLANTGTLPLYIVSFSGFSGNGTGLSQTNDCPLSPSSLSAGGTCTLTFSFAPASSGSVTSSITVSGSESGFTQTINVSGTGIAPAVTLSSSALTFAGEDVGTSSSAQTETVTNTGNANLTFGAGAVTVSGSNATDFSVTSDTCSSQSIAPNGTCAVDVTFKPSTAGNEAATLNFADNASGSPQAVPLSGTGEDFGVAVASGTPSSATVTAGSGTSYSLSVAPEGGFNQAVSLACTGAPSKATCTVSPASVTLNGTNAAAVNVNVTTTAASVSAPLGPTPPVVPPLVLWFIIFGLGGLAFVYFRPQSIRVRTALLAPLGLLLISVALWTSCGGGGGGGGGTTPVPGTPAGTYTLTVTGTSSGLQHSTSVTLVVK